MNYNHVLALIVGYFLSKYDDYAYVSLGYRTKRATHVEIGRILGVKANSIKNMRDEFDPIHDNRRVGWYQRKMSATRLKVVELFQDLTKEELFVIVKSILKDPRVNNRGDIEELISLCEQHDRSTAVEFTSRGITGRKAEEFFINYFTENNFPCPGELKDRRNDGCGYDFEITSPGRSIQVEVKGMESVSGGISLTSKEWLMACAYKDTYYLAIVRDVSISPTIQFICNPASKLYATKRIYTTVQVSWDVSEKNLILAKRNPA